MEGPIAQDKLSFYWHHKGVIACFPFADRCRIVADMGRVTGSGHPPDPSLADVQAIVDERGPTGVRLFDPYWLAGFRINGAKLPSIAEGVFSWPAMRPTSTARPAVKE